MTEVSKLMMLCILFDMTGATNETDNMHECSPPKTGCQRRKHNRVKQQHNAGATDAHAQRMTHTKSYKTRK